MTCQKYMKVALKQKLCDPDLCNCHHVLFQGFSSLLHSLQFLLKAVRLTIMFLFLICSSYRFSF